ncbi:MAG: Dabb family protein [Abitibacteriaceae bacterium]|nr:Dabb family protein [Abditibacteriaceae bacterium]MBV9868354.1 Dabb family protein [Abditibacteriaceae bacterium]
MVEHLVWFKLKEGVTEEQQQAMLNALRALKEQIDGIEHIACGEDFSGRSNGYQIGLVVQFTSRQALDQYQPHPIHQAFVSEFKPLWDSVQALDFEA